MGQCITWDRAEERDRHVREHIPFAFADRRGWYCCSWISRKLTPSCSKTFEELCEQATRRSDHGEERAVDIYPDGAVCWYRDPARR